MNAPKNARLRVLAIVVLACTCAAGLWAQSVTTVPVGAVTLTIAAGTGTGRVITVLSFPLMGESLASGQISGSITSFTSNTISNASAGWTSGALSVTSAPYLIQITSGSAKGLMMLISSSISNTGTTVTIDSEESGLVDLTTTGIVAGDTYELIPCDTIQSILGDPSSTGILGGPNSTSSDIVQMLVQGAYRQYYYNTNSNAWLRVGPNTNSNNVPVRPDSLLFYSRLASSPIALVVTGSVPSVGRKAIIRNSGITTLSAGIPVDITLANLGLNLLPGWITSTSSSAADIVMLQVQGAYRQYYYNGAHWLRVGPGTVSDGATISAGSGLIIGRVASNSGATLFSQDLPYSL